MAAPGGVTRWTVSLADVPTELRANGSAHLAAMAHTFEALPPTTEAARATIDFSPGRIALPARALDQDLGDQRGWHLPDGILVEQDPGLTARVTAGRAEVRGSCDQLSLVFRWICQPALSYVLAPHQRYLLHAAAVARGGRALLLIGESGSGKSTLTYAALRAGWDVLADDHVVLKRGASGIEICGFPKPPTVPGEVALGLPGGSFSMRGDERARWELPSNVLAGGWYPLEGAVWAGHGRDETGSLEALDRLDFMRELVASFPASGNRRWLQGFMPLAAWVTRNSTHRLRLGTDARRRLDDGAELLERALAGDAATRALESAARAR